MAPATNLRILFKFKGWVFATPPRRPSREAPRLPPCSRLARSRTRHLRPLCRQRFIARAIPAGAALGRLSVAQRAATFLTRPRLHPRSGAPSSPGGPRPGGECTGRSPRLASAGCRYRSIPFGHDLGSRRASRTTRSMSSRLWVPKDRVKPRSVANATHQQHLSCRAVRSNREWPQREWNLRAARASRHHRKWRR